MGNDSLRSSPRVLGLLVSLLEVNRFGTILGEPEEGQVVSSVSGGILGIEARDMDTKLLSAPESNNTLARCWFRRNVPVIIVAVVIVVMVVLVVVVGEGYSTIKRSFVIIGSLHRIVLYYLIY
ncbi:hypothetical protein Tco_0349784 [Tanacetum coccineum]